MKYPFQNLKCTFKEKGLEGVGRHTERYLRGPKLSLPIFEWGYLRGPKLSIPIIDRRYLLGPKLSVPISGLVRIPPAVPECIEHIHTYIHSLLYI